MRIPNTVKQHLLDLLKSFPELNESLFSFTGEDAIFEVKFRDNYFTFNMRMIDTDRYENIVTSVDRKEPITHELNSADTFSYFKNWASGIADDIKYRPNFFKKVEYMFPPVVAQYSETFPLIYNQALTAEENGLTEICGLGYRKAFEFLIREYLMKKRPEADHEKIKTLPASQCISQYVTDDNVKLVARRVLWLGNDHAHYLKKWENKNVSDMKNLIDLTIHWMKIKDDLEELEADMPDDK